LLDMRMRVDAAGSDDEAGCIDLISAATKALADRQDGFVANADIDTCDPWGRTAVPPRMTSENA